MGTPSTYRTLVRCPICCTTETSISFQVDDAVAIFVDPEPCSDCGAQRVAMMMFEQLVLEILAYLPDPANEPGSPTDRAS